MSYVFDYLHASEGWWVGVRKIGRCRNTWSTRVDWWSSDDWDWGAYNDWCWRSYNNWGATAWAWWRVVGWSWWGWRSWDVWWGTTVGRWWWCGVVASMRGRVVRSMWWCMGRSTPMRTCISWSERYGDEYTYLDEEMKRYSIVRMITI